MKKLKYCLAAVIFTALAIYIIAGYNNQELQPGNWTPTSQFAAITVFCTVAFIAVLGIIKTPKDQL